MVYTYTQISNREMDSDFKFFVNRGSPKKCMEFLMQGKDMKNEYLGACLDYMRWGGQETVMSELGTKGMINFIRQWMNLNKTNLIWNEKTPPKNLTLPYIKHNKCPIFGKHKGTINDLGGKVRCAHKSEKKFKPSFIGSFSYFDKERQMQIVNYSENEPRDNLPDCAWDENTGKLLDSYKNEWEAHQKQMEKFENENPTFIIDNYCYAILSDEKTILSLEKVLDRLNLQPRTKTVYCSGFECKRIDEIPKNERELYEGERCGGHKEENDITIHPFSGWKLAWYVQKWYEQVLDGKSPVFEK